MIPGLFSPQYICYKALSFFRFLIYLYLPNSALYIISPKINFVITFTFNFQNTCFMKLKLKLKAYAPTIIMIKSLRLPSNHSFLLLNLCKFFLSLTCGKSIYHIIFPPFSPFCLEWNANFDLFKKKN